ncbi:glycosyltransferase [Methylacidimicrobium sp. B4]|uniref:glycosyltransferase n=1 Tax=Methylacidimicrobium sp. B4 TaxID=2796139 RepID=UPI001A8E6FDF|nr:glycosyltransferase [Methylacidimicrobium sp. B4]QSR84387.1 glycosyltransferase [Methylacidimicrobium sp. B4]
MKRIAVFSLATPDRIAHARVLFAGLARHNPGWERHLFLIDCADGLAGFPDGLACQRSIEELAIPDLSSRFVRYSLMEATNSIKPFGFRRLFAEGFDGVFYLDADIWVLSELREAQEALSQHPLLLTPHLLEPLPQDDLEPTEEAIRRAGSYNGGFLAMRETPETRSFLDWWERRLTYDCLERTCYDQSWLNFVPCFVPKTLILRHPGYNLAYWNLPNRGLSWKKGGVPQCADGRPVRFFHFSGFDWKKPEILSKWDTRSRDQPLPPDLSALIEGYLLALRSEGVERWSRVPARLGLSEGSAIPDFLLDWLRQQPVFGPITRDAGRAGEIEQTLRDFLLLPDKTYPWLPIFLGRTLEALPSLRETFRCGSGSFVQDVAAWFEGVGRSALGFGPLFPSRGWWTQEPPWERHLPELERAWESRASSGKVPSAALAPIRDHLSSLRDQAPEGEDRPESRLGLSEGSAIPDFLLDWLRQQPAFQAAVQAGLQGRDLEEALRDFLLLPDKAYPWLPIFLGRTFDALPGLRETFRCESGFFVQDLATWFESVGRSALGFGPLFPSRGWWTQEPPWETHLRRALERWLRRKRGLLRRATRYWVARGLRNRLLERSREERRPRLSVDQKPRIHVYGHFLQANGVAEAARSTVRALERLGYPYRAIHVPDASGAPELGGPLPLSLPGSDAPIAIVHARCRELRAVLQLHPEIGRFAQLRIAYWSGALEEDPAAAREGASLVDEIWCPSEFDAATLRRSTGKMVRVAGLNADVDAIETRADRSIGIDLGLEGKCVFLVLADFLADPDRENPLLALRAYLRAFPAPSSDRLLLLKVSHVERNPSYFGRLVADASARPDILLLQLMLPRPKFLGLLLASTALLSLHANASFGVSIAEMLSLGKPVVATAYGGNTEIGSPKNMRRVGYRPMEGQRPPEPGGEAPPRVEPLGEEAVPHLQAIYRDWLQGHFRELRPDPGIHERSLAMYAGNLRALERLLPTEPAGHPNRSAP